MPKTIDRDLLDCLQRPNPYVEHRVEISAPDVGLVLRRPDQFLGADSLIISGPTPANSLGTGIGRSLQLAATPSALATFTGEQSSYDLNLEDIQRRLKGVSWRVDHKFNRALLRSVVVRLKRVAYLGYYYPLDFALQVYRVTRIPGTVGTAPVTRYAHTPLLSGEGAVVKNANIAWAGSPQKATITFDLLNYGLLVDNGPPDAVSPDQTSELPNYYFVVRPINPPSHNSLFSWMVDTATTRSITDVGTFQRSYWNRDSDQQEWGEQVFSDCPYFILNVDSYPASGQAVYVVDLGRPPITGTTGRVVFERTVPRGTTATLEISTAGSSGPWTAVAHDDLVTVAQQIYHLRVTLTTDAATRASPGIQAMGLEFRTPIDVSLESILEFPSREIQLPWGEASIPASRLSVLRTGMRDYLDAASVIGSTKPAPQLEADIYLASRHPSITRSKWLRLERMSVSDRFPGPTGEVFSLLSYASKLKRKIPQKAETLSAIHPVSASTTAQVTVSTALVGASAAGNEYDGKHYYMRVRSSAEPAIPRGFIQEISDNTGTDKLDFFPALPAALLAGDVIEVHSGIFVAQPIVWKDADPAQVWEDVLFAYGGIPSERVGHGSLPRGGYPPRVADRAPGDTATQGKLTVTNRISEAVTLYELLDQVSAIMGGATIEIDGQICFVQLYPLRAADGTITVPLPAAAAVFDIRDIAFNTLSTPPGLESRATLLSAGYGNNLAAADPNAYPLKATVVVDNDALAWLTKQDLEEVGASEAPESIAKWCYNSIDEGLFLATQLASARVRALSTGLRVFSFQSVDARPELMAGDSVVIITDQYTDYDPATATALRGPLAIRGVLVSVGGAGRVFRVFVGGLAESVAQLSGGNADPYPYFLGQTLPEALFGLKLEVISETTTERTYRVTKGAFVDDVWLGVMEFDSPLPPDPWPQVAAITKPMAVGVDTFTVLRPSGKRVTLIQVEPRAADFSVTGKPWQATLEAAPPQPPVWEIAKRESGGVGTLFFAPRARGEPIVSVSAQVRVGRNNPQAWTVPTRGAGDYSYIKARTLLVGEYEQDVRLEWPGCWVQPRAVLASGEVDAPSPIYFDADSVPDILVADGTGSVAWIVGDSDTASIKLERVNADGTPLGWQLFGDGPSLKSDVQKDLGIGGLAPMGAGETWRLRATAYALPSGDPDVLDSANDVKFLVVSGSTTTPPAWDYMSVARPAALGSVEVPIVLDADSASGLTTRVRARYNVGNGFVELDAITSALTPVPGAPPLSPTTYTWAGLPALYERTDAVGDAREIELEIIAEIMSGAAVVADKTKGAVWHYGGVEPPSPPPPPPGTPEEPPTPPVEPPATAPDPTWETPMTLAGPSLAAKNITIGLDADSSDGAVELLVRSDDGYGWTDHGDIASAVTPALSAPPVAPTSYNWNGLSAFLVRTASGRGVKVEVTAQIIKNGIIVATDTKSVVWLYTDTRL